jgi:arsenate reductase
MAAGLARAFGSDIFDVESAGLAPASFVPALTREVMRDRKVDISSHFPKSVREVDLPSYDLIINMSGYPIPPIAPVRTWDVPDPIGGDKEEYERAAQIIESMVTALIAEYRSHQMSQG